MNELIFNKLIGVDVHHAAANRAQVLGLGSILQDAIIAWQPHKRTKTNLKKNWKKYICRTTESQPLAIWGSGFIQGDFYRLRPYRPLEVLALRGKLSLSILESAIGQPLHDVVLGDPGLLISRLFDNHIVPKRYKLGIIPHYSDANNPLIEDIIQANNGCHRINILDKPNVVIADIAQCERIVSTALHGLIAADSLGIPNRWIKVSDEVRGRGFKFHDYYSTFGITTEAIDMRTKNDKKIDLDDVFYENIVDIQRVKNIADQLLEVMKRYLQNQKYIE